MDAQRHSTYVSSPDTGQLVKYVLTLLAQRRELQISGIHQELLHSTDGQQRAEEPGAGAKLAYKGVSNATLDAERKGLQAELTLPLECSYGLGQNEADALHDAVLRSGTPLAGVPEALSLLWFFKSRQACLAVEQEQLQQHITAVHTTHLQHTSHAAAMCAGTVPPPMSNFEFDHAGPLEPNGSCACAQELAAAEQCMAAVLEAQADAAARVARLAHGFSTRTATGAQSAIDPGDWGVVLLHAAWVAPGGRIAQRLASRASLLSQSHNHRYPALEQVAGEDLARDWRMAKLNLRHPPHVVRHASQVAGFVEGFIDSMDLHAQLAAAAQKSEVLDGSAPTKATGGVWGGSDACMHHRHLYIARRALPLLLKRQEQLWPESPKPLDMQQLEQLQQHARQGTNQSAGSKERIAGVEQPPAATVGDAPSAREQLHVVDVMSDQLSALTPSLEGDDSASSVAALRATCLHVDEGLKAEAAYLEACGSQTEVCTRMQLLAQGHAARWSVEDPVATARAEAAASTGGALAAAVAADTARSLPAHLEPKEMEAYYTLRFLKTRGDRLKVLHYLNAAVSLQLQLLHDEHQESLWTDPLVTRAHKPFTCPVTLAHANKAEAEREEVQARYSQTVGQGGFAASPAGAGSKGDAFEPDVWETDEDAGVAVRKRDGRWVVYRHALTLFHQLEEELLRAGTHYMECYAHQLHAVGRGAEMEELSRQSLLVDIWHHEAQFMGARHQLLVAYASAYRHATDGGLEDMFVQLDQRSQQSGSASAPASPRGSAFAGPDASFAGTGLHRPEFVPGWGGGGVEHSSRPSVSDAGSLAHVTANEPQPMLLSARRQLRREMMDICFRRPKLSVDDGYFVGRYFRATKTLEMETALVRQLCAAAAQEDRASLSFMAQTARSGKGSAVDNMQAEKPAAAAAAAAKGLEHTGAGAAEQEQGARGGLWQPGLPPGIVYGPLLVSINAQMKPEQQDNGRGLMRGGPLLPAVGAAAAALPGLIRKAMNELADVHQVRHYLELAEMRRTVLQYVRVELDVLLQEEAQRAFSLPAKMPKDSKYRTRVGSIGDGEAPPELQEDVGLQTCQLSWLTRSHVADNPLVFLGVAHEVGCSGKAAVEVLLSKELLVRQLYESEVQWLVYQAQSRALGKKVTAPELHGIDWANLNVEGRPLKPENLTDAWTPCEPSDAPPTGANGPSHMPGKFRSPLERAVDSAGDESSGSYVMMGIGRAGVLGGVWRAPPLALAEYSTSLAEMLQIYTLAGLRNLLHPRGCGRTVLAAAAQAQALQCCTLRTAINHNQVLLDFVVRRLDLQRRMLLWGSAAVEGTQPDESMDVTVGAPPRSYRPSFWVPTNHVQPYELKANPPPLLADPPLPKVAAYRLAHPVRGLHKAGGDSMSGSGQADVLESSLEAAPVGIFAATKVEELLNPSALQAFADVRRRLVDTVGVLWMDVHELKLNMRTAACKAFVHAIAAVAEHSRLVQRRSSVASRRSTAVNSPFLGGGHGASSDADDEEEGWEALTEADAVRLEVWSDVYLRGMVSGLEGPALRTQLVHAARQLALSVLGSTGGTGNRWGLRLHAERQCMEINPAELGPGVHWLTAVEGGNGGVAHLEQLLQDYGPLWQAADLSPIAYESGPWEYRPLPYGHLPPGLMFLNQEGQLRLDHMWQLPTPLEVLAMGLVPANSPSRFDSGAIRLHATSSSTRMRLRSGSSVGQPSPPASFSQVFIGSPHISPVMSTLGELDEEGSEQEDHPAAPRPSSPFMEPASPGAGSSLTAGMGGVAGIAALREKSRATDSSSNSPQGAGARMAPPKLKLRLEPLEPSARQHLLHGIQVAVLMQQHLRAALLKAILLAPSAQLAHGGDASHVTSMVPYVPEEKPLAQSLLEPKIWRTKSQGLPPQEGQNTGASPTQSGGTPAGAPPSDTNPTNLSSTAARAEEDHATLLESAQNGATASNRHAAARKWRQEQGESSVQGAASRMGGGAGTEGNAGDGEQGQWLKREFLSGRPLLDHMGQVAESCMAPFLPGALLVSSLSSLHSKLAYLMQPARKVKGRSSSTAVASATVPAAPAIQHLQQEAQLFGLTAMVAVVRAQDAFTCTPQRHVAWHQAGALEVSLAHTLVTAPPEHPPLLALAMLRMRDAERVALHNEIEHVQLVVERVVQECGVSHVLQPSTAVELALHTAAGMWAHDRLRDALVWRVMLMETPTQYPSTVPSESDFLRRYHDAPIGLLPPGPIQPVSPKIRAWMEQTYEARVADKAQDLLVAAAPFAPSTSPDESANRLANTPGHPAWVAQSPLWGSREGRAMEAALCIMKQELDMQAMQVALLRLHKDCVQLARTAVPLPPANAPTRALTPPSVTLLEEGSVPAVTAPLTAPLQALVRRLVAHKQLAVTQGGAGIVYEICAEDMAAWLSEAVAAAAAEGFTAARAAYRAAAQERAMLAHLAQQIAAQVWAQASQQALHVRRHEIRVESHLVDRAMLLLQELSFVRRAAVRSQEDAANATEMAYMAAQTQHANVIKDLQNALQVAHSNMVLQRHDMQRRVLEAMMEVRHETLAKAFGGTPGTSRSQQQLNQGSHHGSPRKSSMRGSRVGGDSGFGGEGDGSEEEEDVPQLMRSPTAASRKGSWVPPPSGSQLGGAPSLPRSPTGRSFAAPSRANSLAPTEALTTHSGAQGQQGSGREGAAGGGGIARILELESEVEVLEANIIDMERAITKVQTWFKMRSSAFQAACMKEVVESRERVKAIEGSMWEMREAYELKLENASIQLKATQADLEVAVAGLARSSMDLTHALSSNKRLLSWKVTQAPRVEAMRMQLLAKGKEHGNNTNKGHGRDHSHSHKEKQPSSKEAWLEWMGSTQGMLSKEPLLQPQQHPEQLLLGKQRAASTGHNQEQGWKAERQALRREVASLRLQLAQQQQPQALSEEDMQQQIEHQQHAHSATLGADEEEVHFIEADEDQEDDVPLLTSTMDRDEMEAAYQKAIFERSELQHMLEQVRALAPDAVQAVEQNFGGHIQPAYLTPSTPSTAHLPTHATSQQPQEGLDPQQGHPFSSSQHSHQQQKQNYHHHQQQQQQEGGWHVPGRALTHGSLSGFGPRHSGPTITTTTSFASPHPINTAPRSTHTQHTQHAQHPALPRSPSQHLSRPSSPAHLLSATSRSSGGSSPTHLLNSPRASTRPKSALSHVRSSTPPASTSVAGSRYAYSTRGPPTMRVAIPQGMTAAPPPPFLEGDPTVPDRCHSTHAQLRGKPNRLGSALRHSSPAVQAARAPAAATPAAEHPQAAFSPPVDHIADATGSPGFVGAGLQGPPAALHHCQQPPGSSGSPSPSSARFTAVQTSKPHLQVTASKLSTDPLPAASPAAEQPAGSATPRRGRS